MEGSRGSLNLHWQFQSEINFLVCLLRKKVPIFLALDYGMQELTRDKDGKLEVNLKYPHYFPIMERCKVWQFHSLLIISL